MTESVDFTRPDLYFRPASDADLDRIAELEVGMNRETDSLGREGLYHGDNGIRLFCSI